MEHKAVSHPTIIKKIKTFLEVERKMGLIPQPTNQYRPPQLDTNLKIRKDNAVEKRNRATPTKRIRPSVAPKSSKTATCPTVTISKAPVNVKPQTDAPKSRPPPLKSAPVSKNTPWPSAGRMLLPPNYLNNDSKSMTGITSPQPSIKEEPKIGEHSNISLKTDKCGWGPNCPFCKNQDKEDWDGKIKTSYNRKCHPSQTCKGP